MQAELAAYRPSLACVPAVVAANKVDALDAAQVSGLWVITGPCIGFALRRVSNLSRSGMAGEPRTQHPESESWALVRKSWWALSGHWG